MSKAWKALESEVAKMFGGVRNVRVSYGESDSDITHPKLSIECKYGAQVPKKFERFGFIFSGCVVLKGACMEELFSDEVSKTLEIENGVSGWKFVHNGLSQASSYSKDKVPVLCVKRPGMRGFRVIMPKTEYDKIRRENKANLWVCDVCNMKLKDYHVLTIENRGMTSLRMELCYDCKKSICIMLGDLQEFPVIEPL